MGEKMKKRQIRLVAILVSSMFVLTGCGPTPLHEMTDEERDIVVHYAAYVVGKHNIYQKDGMTNADPEQWLEAEEEPITTEESQENVDSSLSNGSETSSAQTEISQQKITLEEALGVKDKASVTYKGFKTSDTYQEGNYYSLNTVFGKTFLIMNFTIKNTSSKDLKIDAFSNNSLYAVSVDGKEQGQAEQTFLTYSLSTYQGKLKSGESVDVVLLFEIPAEESEGIKDVKMSLRQKGVNYLVEL